MCEPTLIIFDDDDHRIVLDEQTLETQSNITKKDEDNFYVLVNPRLDNAPQWIPNRVTRDGKNMTGFLRTSNDERVFGKSWQPIIGRQRHGGWHGTPRQRELMYHKHCQRSTSSVEVKTPWTFEQNAEWKNSRMRILFVMTSKKPQTRSRRQLHATWGQWVFYWAGEKRWPRCEAIGKQRSPCQCVNIQRRMAAVDGSRLWCSHPSLVIPTDANEKPIEGCDWTERTFHNDRAFAKMPPLFVNDATFCSPHSAHFFPVWILEM